MIHAQDFKTRTEVQDSKIPIHTIINIETIKDGTQLCGGCFYRVWYVRYNTAPLPK